MIRIPILFAAYGLLILLIVNAPVWACAYFPVFVVVVGFLHFKKN